jgi:putative ABC transport system permease protein
MDLRGFARPTHLTPAARPVYACRMGTLAADIRYAFRQFRRSPAFALAAILTVALGVGANTAIFSVIDTVMLRPLPYAHPERLIFIWESGQPRTSLYSFSYPRFEFFRSHLKSFEGVAAYDDETVTFSNCGEPERIEGGRISREFFSLLDARPAIGRAFSVQDDSPGGPPVAILSDRLWQRRFASDPDVVGKTVRLDGQDYTILGVMPRGFQFLGEPVDVWRPRVFETGTFAPASVRLGATYLTVIGRLRPGVSLATAKAEVAVTDALCKKEYSGNSDAANTVFADLLSNQIFGNLRSSLYLLWGAVTCLLLIACANVANLLLARALSRRREIVTRLALGATRGRVARQLLTESVAISLCGGALAVLIAQQSVDSLVAVLRQSTPQIPDVRLNPLVLAFTLLVCVCAGIAFGAAPVLLSVRTSLSGGARGETDSRTSRRFRGALVAAEVALCVVLLSAAGLLTRSLLAMRSEPLGLAADHVLTLPLTLMKERYEDWDRRTQFYDEVARRVAEAPGIVSAGITSRIDLLQNGLGYIVLPEGAADAGVKNAGARGRSISPEYLRTLGIPVLQGRGFTARDTATAPRVMLVNQSFARRFFPGGNPIGRHVTYSTDRIVCEIVGVVHDVRASLQAGDAAEEFYLPLAQRPWLTARLVVRVAGDPGRAAAAIRAQVRAVDTEQAVADVRTFEAGMENGMAQHRATLSVVGGFAVVAVLLAAIGIYGVLSYSVAQRSREIAIRMALGANAPAVRYAVVRQSMGYVLAGVAIGAPVAVVLGRLYATLLFRVAPGDPITMAAAILGLGLIAVLASYLPARRAASVDPVAALHGD